LVEYLRLSTGKIVLTCSSCCSFDEISPAGLMNTNDEELATLLADIENWKKNLPPSLQFRGPDSPTPAGVLLLLYSCVLMIFWRVFMRISYSCPAHLKFSLTIEGWSDLVQLTGDAIDWLDRNDKVYDVWMLVAYAATSCALVQYHTWARRQDQDAAVKLKKLRDCIRRWEKSHSPDHMSARRKTAEIIALLYEATQGPPPHLERPALNPTNNVTSNKPPPLGGLLYKNDSSRPGGGVFVARGTVKGAYPETAPGVIINSHSDDEDEDGALPAGAHDDTSGAQSSLGQDGNVNVNPVLNEGGMLESENVHVMNTLDSGPVMARSLEEFALADNWLDGIPGGMFDWGRWEEYFSRIGSIGNPHALATGVISAGLAQSVATPDQGGETRAEEPGRETSENCQFAVPNSS